MQLFVFVLLSLVFTVYDNQKVLIFDFALHCMLNRWFVHRGFGIVR